MCYDIVVSVVFCWLWVCGYLQWMKKERLQDVEMAEMQEGERGRGRQTQVEAQMRRLGMF
jgi:hypothetical protein